MHRFILALAMASVPLVLFGCSKEEPPVPEENQVIEQEEERPEVPLQEEDLVTKNVTYTGILEEGGMTIYQEGSHRLMLSDGKMVMLEPAEGSSVDLSLYVSKLVRITGDVMPTVEAGGTLMQVQEIAWIRREENEDGEEVEMMRVLCSAEVACGDGAECVVDEEGVGVCGENVESADDTEGTEVEEVSEESEDAEDSEEGDVMEEDEEESDTEEHEEESEGESEESEDSEEEDDGEEAEEDSEPEPSPPTSQNGTYEKSMALMLEEDYAANRWTQEYCSSHIGFCVSVHRNWYFKSFGAMSSVLWHVEMGALPVETSGDGPLSVDLKTGDLTALGLSDGDIKIVGNNVIGYRSWSDNRHFEISAETSLREPVEIVTQGLKSSE